jgi:hypothetical protein
VFVAFVVAVAFSFVCHPLLFVIPQASAVAFVIAAPYLPQPTPKFVISTEGGALAAAVERPPHLAFALTHCSLLLLLSFVLFVCHPHRDLPLHLFIAVPYLPNPPQNFVISTEGGALAAAVDRPPHLAFACSPHQSLKLHNRQRKDHPKPVNPLTHKTRVNPEQRVAY